MVGICGRHDDANHWVVKVSYTCRYSRSFPLGQSFISTCNHFANVNFCLGVRY